MINLEELETVEEVRVALCNLFNNFKSSFVDKQIFINNERTTLLDILSINGSISNISVIANIKFNDNTVKKISISTLIALNRAEFEKDADTEEYDNLVDQHNKLMKKYQEIETRAERELLKQAEEEAKARKAEEQYAKRKAAAIQHMNDLENHRVVRNADYFTMLGWLAKHTKTIYAEMPDWYEAWFIRHFGDAQHKVVDSQAKTSGGYAMKWNLSIKLTLDTLEHPTMLDRFISKSKEKTITDTYFLYDLCLNSGFAFGKKQDIDNIRKYVPTEKLLNFETGYNS